jgi:beta-glucanase (GH16 family)
MRLHRLPILLFPLLLGIIASRAFDGELPATRPASWRLVWSDSFSGDRLDRSHWGFDLGNGFTIPKTHQFIPGWGNGELEYYTDRPENVFVKASQLHIRAVAEAYHGCAYTSSRLTTKGRFAQAYGRFEIRAKLPTGQGLWPAIWLLPADNAYGGWAASGEIDLMEARGQNADKVVGTIHYGAAWPGNVHTGKDFSFPTGQDISDFHVYALEWEPGVIRWYVDDRLYSTQRNWWSSSKPKSRNPWPAPFDQPFYLLINLAVGGQFVGKPDAQTAFPAEMLVDYVRVYDKSDYGPVQPPGAKDEKPRE